jgi:hypothetical protein
MTAILRCRDILHQKTSKFQVNFHIVIINKRMREEIGVLSIACGYLIVWTNAVCQYLFIIYRSWVAIVPQFKKSLFKYITAFRVFVVMKAQAGVATFSVIRQSNIEITDVSILATGKKDYRVCYIEKS